MSDRGVNHIELRLRELAQLFNSMDPAPFRDRDLDPAAETFIVDTARELPAGRGFELVIHLTAPGPKDQADGVEEAVHNYFHNRLRTERRRLRRLFQRGRWSLGVGVLFLITCLTIANLVGKIGADSPLFATAKLTLDIIGWVALWRPLEIFLYDWWPLRDDIRLYECLARMPVRVILPSDPR